MMMTEGKRKGKRKSGETMTYLYLLMKLNLAINLEAEVGSQFTKAGEGVEVNGCVRRRRRVSARNFSK